MLIGQDFDKISFEFLGYDLLEPNVFLGDTIITILSLILAYKTYKIYRKIRQPFFYLWAVFFVIFAFTFFTGGLGHLCYNYWSVEGRSISWFLGVVAVYFSEISMISLLKERNQRILLSISKVKLLVMVIGISLMLLKMDLANDVDKGMILPTINTLMGFVFAFGILGYRFSKLICPDFKYLYISVIVLLPSLIFQGLKINFHQWMDRNDVSHILLLICLVLYYLAIRGYASQIVRKQQEY